VKSGWELFSKLENTRIYQGVPENFPTCGDWFPSETKKKVDMNLTDSKDSAIYNIEINRIPVGENELLPLVITASPLIHPHESRVWSDETSAASSLYWCYLVSLYPTIAYCLSLFRFHL
jgi:hypothetical protein